MSESLQAQHEVPKEPLPPSRHRCPASMGTDMQHSLGRELPITLLQKSLKDGVNTISHTHRITYMHKVLDDASTG